MRMISAPTENEKKVLTMSEYIEREATYEDFEKCNSENPKWTPSRVKTLLARQKAADVAPVRHGRWVTPHWHNSDYCYNCSECGGEAMHREYQWARNGIYPICPNCGAKMDGGAD